MLKMWASGGSLRHLWHIGLSESRYRHPCDQCKPESCDNDNEGQVELGSVHSGYVLGWKESDEEGLSQDRLEAKEMKKK